MDTRQRYRYGNKLSAVSVPIVMAWFIIAKDILVLRFGRTHTAATFFVHNFVSTNNCNRKYDDRYYCFDIVSYLRHSFPYPRFH